jgi:hypothetical protein
MKIFFAGGEQNTLSKALLSNGVKHVLYSYFYIWQHHREYGVFDHQMNNPEVEFFLDSGAFSYMSAVKMDNNLPPVEEYAQMYFRFIQKYGTRYSRIAELDLDYAEGVTMEQVRKWRAEMLSSWPNLPIIPVWHKERGVGEWELYCKDKRYQHLGFGSGVADYGLMMRLIGIGTESQSTDSE